MGGINTTAHNISNTETSGYCRQVLNQFVSSSSEDTPLTDCLFDSMLATMASCFSAILFKVSPRFAISPIKAVNLIRFQHAYNAAARYINVVDEMLEHIVTRM